MARTEIDFDDYLQERMKSPEFARGFREARERSEIALQIAKLRELLGLTQTELAARVGTSQQTISRLENPDYRGHSLRTLRRIADALDARVEVRIVPRNERVH